MFEVIFIILDLYQAKFYSDYLHPKDDSASLAIENNPVDTYGSITKKRGVVIRSASELDEISSFLSHPKVDELSKKVDAVNPKRESTTGKGGPDIFEI